jgi:probable HAF family extracellular repeat protein
LAINQQGQVVGWSENASGTIRRAFLYSNGSMIGPGSARSERRASQWVNNLGQIVGSGYGVGGFVYADGQVLSLDPLIDRSTLAWSVYDAAAINDAGQLAADRSSARATTRCS